MLHVAVPRALSQTIQEVDSRKVPVGDFEHVLGQRLGRALVEREIGDLKRDEAWDDVDRHRDSGDLSHPVGGIQDERVVHSLGFRLHVLDVPAVDVLLGKRVDRGVLGSDVALLRFDVTPEKAMRRGHFDCECNLRRQIVLVSDLQRSKNTHSLVKIEMLRGPLQFSFGLGLNVPCNKGWSAFGFQKL